MLVLAGIWIVSLASVILLRNSPARSLETIKGYYLACLTGVVVVPFIMLALTLGIGEVSYP